MIEIIIFSIRLWTRGYDVYSPNRNIIGHDYQNNMMKSAPNNIIPAEEVSQLEWVR